MQTSEQVISLPWYYHSNHWLFPNSQSQGDQSSYFHACFPLSIYIFLLSLKHYYHIFHILLQRVELVGGILPCVCLCVPNWYESVNSHVTYSARLDIYSRLSYASIQILSFFSFRSFGCTMFSLRRFPILSFLASLFSFCCCSSWYSRDIRSSIPYLCHWLHCNSLFSQAINYILIV